MNINDANNLLLKNTQQPDATKRKHAVLESSVGY